MLFRSRAGKKPDAEKKTASTKLVTSPKQEKIVKALAKLTSEDRAAAEKQKFCAVLPKSELGSVGMPIKLVREGKPVFLCCEACLDSAIEKWPNVKVEKLKQATLPGAAQ